MRASLLADLLCGAVEVKPGQVGGVYLDRVRVVGKLELQGAILKYGLRLHNCYVPEGIDLLETSAQTIELQGCHVGAIRLDRAKINGVFILSGAHLDKGLPPVSGAGLVAGAHAPNGIMPPDGGAAGLPNKHGNMSAQDFMAAHNQPPSQHVP